MDNGTAESDSQELKQPIGADCGGRCPVTLSRGYCCCGCRKARRKYYEQHWDEPEIQAAWQPDSGFWDARTGCRLPRPQRPVECLEYDCRERIYLLLLAYLPNGRWVRIVREVRLRDLNREILHGELDSARTALQTAHNAHRAKQLGVKKGIYFPADVEGVQKCRSSELFIS